MKFNLIDEKWIPVKRKDGTPDRIRPWEVTDDFEKNPVVALDAPRPDFNGALIQFLIGLVQTTFAPAKPIEWKQKLRTAPSPDQLKTAFMTVHHAFELGGDGPRFMQDFNKLETKAGTIDGLLIDTPGEKTCEDNTDHFIKRNAVRALCPSCCATAIFTMQTNSPAGGSGYRTSLRGGGPLTTIVIGDKDFDMLWHTIWLNVLEAKTFLSMCNSTQSADSNKFPWLSVTKAQITEQDIHPAQYFWAMPRRINLDTDAPSSGNCDICSQQSDDLIVSYKEVNKGTEYKAPMKHPLSAFDTRIKKNQKTQKEEARNKALLTQPGGVGYRHWLGLVLENKKVKKEGDKEIQMGGIEAARVVHEYINERQMGDWQLRLWAFGYDMGNMKARCWYESMIPLISVESSIKGAFEDGTVNMIKASSEIVGNLRSAAKAAWFKRPGDIKGNMSFVDSTFWQNTESVFYETLNGIITALASGGDSISARIAWHKTLCDEALRIFDMLAWNGPVEDADPRRVVKARKAMESYNNGKKIKELLGLPVTKKTTAKGKKKATP
jgi:CRISPR system Cascade subunit CasA